MKLNNTLRNKRETRPNTAGDVKEVNFGDSSLKRHANCHYGAYSEINIRACCK